METTSSGVCYESGLSIKTRSASDMFSNQGFIEFMSWTEMALFTHERWVNTTYMEAGKIQFHLFQTLYGQWCAVAESRASI